jgi:hypothetical protein
MKKQPNFKKARDYALGRLENELSPKLTYHWKKSFQPLTGWQERKKLAPMSACYY